MTPFTTLTARTVVVPQANIDTDQIIPARFLRTTSREGLGKSLFADRPEFLRGQEGAVLVAGPNFGCGSSREHAPWALLDRGFRAVVSARIADIFRGNALKNGLLPIELDDPYLMTHPGCEIAIDLAACTVSFDGRSAQFAIDPFARRCLLSGLDELGYLLSAEKDIAAFEASR
jgi:3-isopropylmalate/(R)-2-methylmalate dehydratase small subunit